VMYAEGGSMIDYLTAIKWCNTSQRPMFLLDAMTDKKDLLRTHSEDRVLALDIWDDGSMNGCGDICKFTGNPRSKL